MRNFVIAVSVAVMVLIGRAEAQGLPVTTPEPGLTSGQCVQAGGISDITPLGCSGRSHYISVTGPIMLSNTDCGAVLEADGGTTQPKITLPGSPLADCEFTFEPGTLGFYIDFNGKTALLPGYHGSVTQWTIPNAQAFRSDNSSISLQYIGTRWEQSAFSSPIYQTSVQPTNAAQLAHGQVYFSWNRATSQFQLCPSNGPGGIIVDGAMREVPKECLTLAQSATPAARHFSMP